MPVDVLREGRTTFGRIRVVQDRVSKETTVLLLVGEGHDVPMATIPGWFPATDGPIEVLLSPAFGELLGDELAAEFHEEFVRTVRRVLGDAALQFP
jgi:hypothetical protein